MSSRTKLTLASLPVMMLPYRIDFSLGVLLITAILTMAVEAAKQWLADHGQSFRLFAAHESTAK